MMYALHAVLLCSLWSDEISTCWTLQSLRNGTQYKKNKGSVCQLKYLPLIRSWSTVTSHYCMEWCWKWQWRASNLLWLQPTLNWRRSCWTRRPGFPLGTVQSDHSECCAVGLLPEEGPTTPRKKKNQASRRTAHSCLYLFIRCKLTSLQRCIFWQQMKPLDEVTRLSKTQTSRLFTD